MASGEKACKDLHYLVGTGTDVVATLKPAGGYDSASYLYRLGSSISTNMRRSNED